MSGHRILVYGDHVDTNYFPKSVFIVTINIVAIFILK